MKLADLKQYLKTAYAEACTDEAKPLSAGNAEKQRTQTNCEPRISLADILSRHSLNMATIERGRTLWKQPFDDDDLNDIETGALTLVQVDEYLALWKAQYPELYEALKVAKVIPIQKPAEDALGSLDGLALLREDHDFIKTKLMRLPRAQWPELIRQYREAWATASINHMAGISADNAGRRAANTWLRELVAKRFSYTVEG